MKTLFINGSPKKRLSASGFIASFTRLFVKGQTEVVQVRNQKKFEEVIHKLEDVDTLVFVLPLYVDGIPSHILPLLKQIELYCREKELSIKVYAIANNGFIEGKQNEPLMQVLENFCTRASLQWCGGLGIGGGVMMNVMRIMIGVFFTIFCLNLLLNGVKQEILFDFFKQVVEVLFLSCGILTFDFWLVYCMNKQKEFGKHYTRIMLPSFVFILCADIFFVIISILQGGIFRGWLSKKQ